MDIKGLTTRVSVNTPADTVNMLVVAIGKLGVEHIIRINHAFDAQKAGLQLLPSEVIIFGNPLTGTPLMQSTPTLALELPLKLLVWSDASGATNVSYNQPDWLAERYGLTGHASTLNLMTDMIESVIAQAIAPVAPRSTFSSRAPK